MSKMAVIYWSQTGNTEAMAGAITEGAKDAGAEVQLFHVSEISADDAAAYDLLALGCPAMGAEVLEEEEFEPFFTALEPKLGGKAVFADDNVLGVLICAVPGTLGAGGHERHDGAGYLPGEADELAGCIDFTGRSGRLIDEHNVIAGAVCCKFQHGRFLLFGENRFCGNTAFIIAWPGKIGISFFYAAYGSSAPKLGRPAQESRLAV